MRRIGVTTSALASLGFAAIIASCSDGSSPEPDVGSLTDPVVIASGQLSGGGWNPAVNQAAQSQP